MLRLAYWGLLSHCSFFSGSYIDHRFLRSVETYQGVGKEQVNQTLMKYILHGLRVSRGILITLEGSYLRSQLPKDVFHFDV